MDFQGSYQECYVVIFDKDNRIVGSGIAYDHEHILTCAHVVNTALSRGGLNLNSCLGAQVRVCFKINPNLSGEDKFDDAVVCKWIPNGTEFTLKNDLAVLKISKEVIKDKLTECIGDIDFVETSSGIMQTCKMICYDTNSLDRSSVEIAAKVSSFIKDEGKTAIYSEFDTMPFIQPGCSGSPVFSNEYHGIIGLLQASKTFKSQPNAKNGFVIDIRNIADHIPEIILKPKGLKYYGTKKQELKFDYQRTNNKNMCDRRDMVLYILKQIQERKGKAVMSFLCTDQLEQEDTDDILIRYKSEFIDPEIHSNILLQVLRIPDETNLTQFKKHLVDEMMEGLSMEYSSLNMQVDDMLADILGNNSQLRTRPLFIVVDCDLDKLSDKHLACFKWLNAFLDIGAVKNLVFECHILFIGKFWDKHSLANLEIVKNGFGINEIAMLTNVETTDIHKWIDRYISDRNKALLRRQFIKKDYPMKEIFEKYYQTNKSELI